MRKPAASVSLRTVRFADVNLNEDEDVVGDPTAVAATGFSEDDGERDESDEEEDEDEEEGMVDLVDILDGKAQPYFADDSDEGAEPGNAASPKAKKQAPRPPPPPGLIFGEAPASDEDDVMASADETGSGSEANEGTSDASEESEGDEADAVDDAHTISASDDDATIGGGALDGLSAFISTLDVSAKRKAESDVPPAGAPAERPRKRRFVQDQTEVGTENEFAARMSTGLRLYAYFTIANG